jgi:hypothetical protein
VRGQALGSPSIDREWAPLALRMTINISGEKEFQSNPPERPFQSESRRDLVRFENDTTC